MKKEISMKFERATKNTFRFAEEAEDTPIIGTLYVQKHVFQGATPSKIKVEIEWE